MHTREEINKEIHRLLVEYSHTTGQGDQDTIAGKVEDLTNILRTMNESEVDKKV